MRKVSILSILLVAGLVVGLAGNVALAAEESFNGGNDSELTLSTNTVLKMRVKSGDSVSLGNISPQESTSVFTEPEGSSDADSTIQVVSNRGWQVQVDTQEVTEAPSSNYNSDTITDALLVKLKDYSSGTDQLSRTGGKGQETFPVKYGWDAMTDSEVGDMPNGDYTLKVTYTVSTHSPTE